MSLFFFLDCYGTHHHLPPFPTRRSSDLTRRHRRHPVSPDNPNAAPTEPRETAAAPADRSPLTGQDTAPAAPTAATAPRSEEHTSELQSQFHLVCRLLLEKKKYKKHYSLR